MKYSYEILWLYSVSESRTYIYFHIPKSGKPIFFLNFYSLRYQRSCKLSSSFRTHWICQATTVPFITGTVEVGTPVILLRNILNPPRLCNGTRLVFKKLFSKPAFWMASSEEKIYYYHEFLLCIPKNMPIELKRVQFPIRLAFASTINNSHGQTIYDCGLDLGTPCLSYGQYYTWHVFA